MTFDPVTPAFAPLNLAETSARKDDSAQVNQSLDALSRLAIDPTTLLRLPWDSLHDVLGYLWPEQFWVVAAATGNGKSTLLMQLTNGWAAEGRRVYFMPLEQKAGVMRQYWAALANNLNPRRVLENDWANLPPHSQDTVKAHIRWQVKPGDRGGRDLVRFSDTALVGAGNLQHEFDNAQRAECSVVVIDHLHRMDLSGKQNGYAALVTLCQTIKECAKEARLPVIVAAQLHRDKEGDIMAPFLPPKPSAIQGGEVVRQESDVAIGLYRPLLDTFGPPDALAVRTGKAKIRPFLEPNTIGVHVLKHRVRGDVLGEIVKLGYDHGRIVCPATQHRLDFESRHDL